MKPVIIVGAGISGLSTASLLVQEKIPVTIYEKNSKVGGRTVSSTYKNHILDNGFHIMPFYKTSSVYKLLTKLNLEYKLELVKVHDISFYQKIFHKYPKGILDILTMSLIPFRSRIHLLKILAPMAFSSMKKAELQDSVPLTQITSTMDSNTKSFLMLFVCLPLLIYPNISLWVNLSEL